MGGDEKLRAELQRLLSVSGADVERLVEEARRDAEARIRGLLTDAFADALLERVRDAPQPPAEPATGTVVDPSTDPAASPTDPVAGSPTGPVAEPPPDIVAGESPTEAAVQFPAPTASEAAIGDAPSTASEVESDALGWYVYCVVGADAAGVPPDLEGIDPDHPVLALDHHELSAIVSRVPLTDFGEEPLRQHLSDMEWLEHTARRHEHVLERLAAQATTIPMRLCSIYRDEAGLRRMLDREAPALQQALAHLDGKVEWGVKAFADLQAAAAAAAEDQGASGTGADGTAYMRNRLTERRRRDEVQQELDRACDAIHATLADVAAEAVTSPPQRPEVSGREVPMVLNASYLVAQDARERFHQQLARLGEEYAPLGIELEATGPWPPYNFVPGVIGAAW